MASGRISLKHLAEACGVSRNTVSLALRGHPSISAATREKVEAAAERLGYVPDPEMSKLMAHLSKRRKKAGIQAELAYISTLKRDDGLPSHPHFFQVAKNYLEANGYRLTPFQLHEEDYSGKDLNRIFKSRGIAGALVAPLAYNRSGVDLDWQGIAGVTIGSIPCDPGLPMVDNDFFYATQLCVRKMREAGYRRIGAIISSSYDRHIRYSATSAFTGAMMMAGERSPIILDYAASGHEKEPSAHLFQTWIEEHELDAVVGLDFDWEHLGKIEKLKFKIPDELGFSLIYLNEQHESELCGVAPDTVGVAEVAAEQLLSAVRHAVYGAPEHQRVTVVKGFWRDGPTIRS